MARTVQAPLDEATVKSLRAGEQVVMTGTIYAARDAAHKDSSLPWNGAKSCLSLWQARSSITLDLRQPSRARSLVLRGQRPAVAWIHIHCRCWNAVSRA